MEKVTRSKELQDLITLRENLDKNEKNVPDYHISDTSYRDSWQEESHKKPKKDKNTEKSLVTQKIKSEVMDLIDYGMLLSKNTTLSVVGSDTKRRIKSFRFRSKPQVASTITEYAKGLPSVIFVINERKNSIYWNMSNGISEVRIVR